MSKSRDYKSGQDYEYGGVLEERADPEVAKKMENWKPDEMSRDEKEKFVRSLLVTVNKAHYINPDCTDGYKKAKDKEPWRPEYDEMCLLFMTPEEIKKRQDKGMAREDIIKDAKKQIVTAMWKEYQRHGGDWFFARDGKDFGDVIVNEKKRSKRFYEEDSFHDDAVGNTLYAISMREHLRPLLKTSDYADTQLIADETLHYQADVHGHDRSTCWYNGDYWSREDYLYKGIKASGSGWFSSAKESDHARLHAIKLGLLHLYMFEPPTEYGNSSVRTKLDGIGLPALQVLNASGYTVHFEAMGNVASCMDMKKKRIMLNSPGLREMQTMSMINAATFLKHEQQNGLEMTKEELAIRKADSIVMQMKFVHEWGDDHIYHSILKWKGYGDLADTFDKTYKEALKVRAQKVKAASFVGDLKDFHGNKADKYKNNAEDGACSKKHALNAAYSAVVDAYLEKELKGKKPSFEKIGRICREFNGQPYYSGRDYFESKDQWRTEECDYYRKSAIGIPESNRLKKKDVVVTENKVTAAIMLKTKQGGR